MEKSISVSRHPVPGSDAVVRVFLRRIRYWIIYLLPCAGAAIGVGIGMFVPHQICLLLPLGAIAGIAGAFVLAVLPGRT